MDLFIIFLGLYYFWVLLALSLLLLWTDGEKIVEPIVFFSINTYTELLYAVKIIILFDARTSFIDNNYRVAKPTKIKKTTNSNCYDRYVDGVIRLMRCRAAHLPADFLVKITILSPL